MIEFLIKNGAERFIEECRDKLYKIRALQDFNFYEGTVDKGSGVREKAKQVVELLGSNEIIRTEREKARVLRNKLVGIDSRNGGNGFGGSGNSYGGSSGNSYGGNGSDSRYDGGGGRSYGGSDSRYGDSGIGGGASGGRYGDSGIGSNNNNNSGGSRYGGGAYDSNRPGRYNDEAPPADSFGGGSSNSRYNDEQPMESEPEPVVTRSTPRKSTSSGVTGVSSTAGKLKVNIKKVGTPATIKAPAAAEVDLIGGDIDLMGGGNDDPFGNSSGGGGSSDFDPFQSAPTPAAAPAAAAFDPFAINSAAPVAPAGYASAAPAFDPFAAAPAPVMMMGGGSAAPGPAFNNNGYPPAVAPNAPFGYGDNNFPPQPAPGSMPMMMGGGMNNYGQPAMQPQQQQPAPMMMGGGAGMNAQYRAPQQQQQQQRNFNLSSQSNDADFGDFTGATPTQQGQQSKAPAAAPADPWGSLVNLSKIEKNEELANKQRQEADRNTTQQYSANSFAGLDGFSKAPQSMVSSLFILLLLADRL